MNPSHRSDQILLLIGALKLLKAGLLIVVAVGALKLLHRDVAAVLSDWVAVLRVDPDNYYFRLVIEKIGFVDDRVLTEISAGSLFYAALLATEGVGLCLRKHWAEYLTVVVTISFLPLEFYALVRQFSMAKAALALLNLAIVWYLIRRIRQEHQPAANGAGAKS